MGFGIVRLDDSGRVIGFVEKPQSREQLDPVRTPEEWMRRRGIQSKGRPYLASMGIYLFNREKLINLLNSPPLATDFGKEIFPRSIESHRVQAHVFDGYWEDLGTVKAYHEANLALARDVSPFDFHSPEGVIYTRMRFLPASRLFRSRARARAGWRLGGPRHRPRAGRPRRAVRPGRRGGRERETHRAVRRAARGRDRGALAV